MDKPNFPEKQATWTTWEELLLACAVHRYGTQSWDSVAAQLRKRCSSLLPLSPQTCKRKFHDLRRRFSHHNDAVCDEDADDVDAASPIPWLDQLRQLRLDELRHEVQRYDVSIVSLQSKVQRLKEVREKSLDLVRGGEEQEQIISVLPVNVAGEGSVRTDGRSPDESNTTDPKYELPETEVCSAGKEAVPVEPAAGDVGAVEKSSNPVEDSCNGSSDSVMKEAPVAEAEKANSGELRESVAESKETKECRSSSDVQSTASLSRKIGPELNPSEPVEPDQEDQSPAMNQGPAVESQPLVQLLGMLRSHKAASFFERRLQSQETPMYINMIRQHIDFESVQTRLDAGLYSSCKSKFFRDVLLICKNAIVFFGNRSPEYNAACELQLLVLKEMAKKDPNQDPSPKEETQTPSKDKTQTSPAIPVKLASESSESLLSKSKLSIPLTACRKRSSIKARASTSSSAPDVKKEKNTASMQDVKPAISWKQKEESLDEVKEQFPVTKKRRKDRVGTKLRNDLNKNGRNRSDANKDKNLDANANAVVSSSRAMISNENSEPLPETEKTNNSNTIGKRQSAENFLSRIKRSSPCNKSETLKIVESDGKGVAEQKKNGNSRGNGQKTTVQRKNGNSKGNAHKEVVEQKKTGNGRGSADKQQGSRRGAGGRQAAKEQESPSKRSVGRPLKRAAETTRAASAKRRRN